MLNDDHDLGVFKGWCCEKGGQTKLYRKLATLVNEREEEGGGGV